MIALPLTFLSLVLLGLMAGFFYAYSVSVMPGFDQIAASEAIRAMQAINVEIHNPVFFVTFFLTPVVCLIAAAALWSGRRKRAALILAIAAIVYVLGAMVPTALVNVPLNRALAAVDTGAAVDAAAIWADFLARWDWWNVFRTVGSTLALVVAGLALLAAGRSGAASN